MGVVIDKILAQPLLHEHPVRLVSSDPTTAKEGTQIINTTDNHLKIYFLGNWWTIYDFTTFMLLDETGAPLYDENNVNLLIE